VLASRAMSKRGVWVLGLLLGLAGCGSSDDEQTANQCPASAATGTELALGERRALSDDWSIVSSAELDATGEKLSTPCYSPEGWTPARVPSTVVGAQVDAGMFGDPFMGRNLRDLLGAGYIPGLDFGNFPTPEDSPYKPSFWYRTDFELAKSPAGRSRTWLHFDGIDYRANIWLNGKQVASQSDVVGMYRRFDFDVSDFALPGRHNVLAVEVFGPDQVDLAHSFMDHNPMPPDKSMGLWHGVSVSATGAVAIRHLAVTSDLALPGLDSAKLTVLADLVNASDHDVSATLAGNVGPIQISETVALGPKETRAVTLGSGTHPELLLKDPELWWPHQLGSQHLYDAALDASVDGAISDHAETSFGIRRIDSEMVDDKWVKFSVNGTPLLVRGAGYEHELFFRWDDRRDDDDIRLVKDMGLNTIRLEGGLASDHFFDVADREGVLVIAGWQCCNAWEHWSSWTDESRPVAKASLESQMRRLRGHPSLLSWWNGSDHVTPSDVEQMYDESRTCSILPTPSSRRRPRPSTPISPCSPRCRRRPCR
jgi:exo-1,4-beta-D-glucosaminidase